MNDALWFLLPAALVVVIAGVAAYLDMRNICSHKWSKWTWSESEYAYFQRRTCEKCGYTELQQRKKLMTKDFQ